LSRTRWSHRTRWSSRTCCWSSRTLFFVTTERFYPGRKTASDTPILVYNSPTFPEPTEPTKRPNNRRTRTNKQNTKSGAPGPAAAAGGAPGPAAAGARGPAAGASGPAANSLAAPRGARGPAAGAPPKEPAVFLCLFCLFCCQVYPQAPASVADQRNARC
jgi:hypothetical protein